MKASKVITRRQLSSDFQSALYQRRRSLEVELVKFFLRSAEVGFGGRGILGAVEMFGLQNGIVFVKPICCKPMQLVSPCREER